MATPTSGGHGRGASGPATGTGYEGIRVEERGQDRPDALSRPGTPENRAQAPIKWPHLSALTIGCIVAWVVGLLVALISPAFIVAPNETTAPPAQLWAAFGLTVLGAAIMLAAVAVLYRRFHEPLLLVMGAIPAFTVILGGVLLVTTKGFESPGQR
jgi:hypothetical protein